MKKKIICKMKKASALLGIMLMLVAVATTSAGAIDQGEEIGASATIIIEPQCEIILDQQENGDFIGTADLQDARSGVRTRFTATLHNNTASIPTRYTLIISWTGDGMIGNIYADEISVRKSLWPFSEEYYYEADFYKSCGGITTGSRTVGYCDIPEDVTSVWIETTGFGATVLNDDLWVSTEIAGTITLDN